MTVIELFDKLLRFKSITPNDDNAFEFITNYLGNDWECIKLDINDVKNRFYRKRFSSNDQHLCFAGHIDVVPAGDGWLSDPFVPKYDKDTITARGTQDMKSGVASLLYACKHTIKFDGTLSILLTSDEEGDAKDGTIKVLEYLKSNSMLPNFAIVAEPTCEIIFGDAIKIGRRGSINGFLTINGKQGHAAYPNKAINPINQIATVLEKISKHQFDNGDEHFAPSKLVITDIRSGMEVTNVTPNNLKMMFNVRNSTKTKQEDIKNFIDENLKNFDFDFYMTQGSYPFMTNKNSKLVKTISKSIKDELNIDTSHSTAGGTSDARFFGTFGIDTVEFGVINDTIHAINEKTTIKEVNDLTKIFQRVIETF